MTAVVTRSRSPISAQGWDELTIPDGYRAEIVDDELVVMPKVAGTVPPITVEEWEAVEVPEPYRAEIVQGELVVSPAASVPHHRVQARLLLQLSPLLPDGYEVLIGPEWLLDERGLVAAAPQPDVIVTPVGIDRITVPPLLAVEVLSPSDAQRLQRGMTRIEGKRLDYGGNGLADYLQIGGVDGRPVVIRYENSDGALVEVDRAEGDKTLAADRPFPYELVPARLLD